ncbi:hypothetical protein EUBC25_21220 [Claveliimonas bilis]|uniref:energy-coupling factor ABC transporter ATP-binding protein n=1 Tax=Claveliimonas bilis TaxID=3028070 RepID=UPI001E5665F0|nr:ABC transporter ATP-binding protein [Claveliimonas bilis]BCZ28035.1 hypothetical protein EUBC25_21220 [Claveliimonas bilis]
MRDIILEARNLSYSYEDSSSPALNGLSLSVARGSKIAVMGANGSGKSTFFLCCNGILRPDRGELLFKGHPVSYRKKDLLELRSKVGIVFQNPDTQLFCASVYQEISFGPLNLGIPEKKAAEAVENIIETLEITDFRHRPAHALSGGQKKQVALADILVMKPEIMILDEPFAALDPVHTRIIRQQIDKMCTSGMTVLLATHNTDYALEWADEVVLLKNGRVLSQDRPDKALTDEELLKETNLELPSVIRLHKFLCSRGMADPSFPVPRNMEDLEKELLAVRF